MINRVQMKKVEKNAKNVEKSHPLPLKKVAKKQFLMKKMLKRMSVKKVTNY